MRTPCLAVILGCSVLLAGVTLPAVSEADPFYVRALDVGSRELSLERYEKAVENLRLACFGLLDEPGVLIRCLVLLAVAQEGRGDSVGIQRTLDRVLEVEDRFQVYGDAPLESGVKQRFEKVLVRLTAESAVEAIPAFSKLVERAAPQPGALSIEQLRVQHARYPEDIPTTLSLARLELDRGKKKQALRRLSELVQSNPGVREARCLRFQANAALGNCTAMVAEMPFCWPLPVSAEEVRSQLQCLVERKEWSTARDLVASLEPEVVNEARVPRLLARIDKNAPSGDSGANEPDEALDAVAEIAAAPDTVGDSPIVHGEASEPATRAHQPLASERLVLADAAGAVESESNLVALEKHLQRVEQIADSYPELTDVSLLAGRLAYRASRWESAVRYFNRSGRLDDFPSLQFYLAVSLYETGHLGEAAEALLRVLPQLEETSFVKSYQSKILGVDRDGESG